MNHLGHLKAVTLYSWFTATSHAGTINHPCVLVGWGGVRAAVFRESGSDQSKVFPETQEGTH
jgi:hypothetical protein